MLKRPGPLKNVLAATYWTCGWDCQQGLQEQEKVSYYGVNALEERQAAELAQHVVNVAVGPVDRSVRHAEVHKWA